MTKWLIIGAMLLVAAAIGIAMIVAVIRDVEADKRDTGGKMGARSKRIDLFRKGRDDDSV